MPPPPPKISSFHKATSFLARFFNIFRFNNVILRFLFFSHNPTALHIDPNLIRRAASSSSSSSSSHNQQQQQQQMSQSTSTNKVVKTEEEWKQILTPEEYYVLRQKGTERPGTGKYNKVFEDGIYRCAGCGSPLYKAETKFNSGCGWPAFYDAIPGAIERHEDFSHGMHRTEITCATCGGHLGHVFKGEGFPTPTDERHCVNSVCLRLEKKPPQSGSQ